ncbi:hypothetical protein GCM10010440_16920 [Kitasatospora cinereorecta]
MPYARRGRMPVGEAPLQGRTDAASGVAGLESALAGLALEREPGRFSVGPAGHAIISVLWGKAI